MKDLIIFYSIISYLMGIGVWLSEFRISKNTLNTTSVVITFIVSPITIPIIIGAYLSENLEK